MVKHHAYHPLYTIIPHGKLIKVLFKIMKISFIGGDKQFTTVRKYFASWTDNEKQGSVVTFTQSSLQTKLHIYHKTAFSTWEQNIQTSDWKVLK